MRVVSESEVLQTLPSLLGEVDKQTVVIRRDDRELAYVVSPEQYATTREARTQRVLDLGDALSAEIESRAAASGLNLEDLMRSLDRKAS